MAVNDRKRWLKYAYGLCGVWHLDHNEDKWIAPSGWAFTDGTIVDFQDQHNELLPLYREPNNKITRSRKYAFGDRLIAEGEWP